MNTTEPTAKCRCQHCDGHLEFDPAEAGRPIDCPHCGMETILYVPGENVSAPFDWEAFWHSRHWAKVGIAVGILFLLGILSAVGFFAKDHLAAAGSFGAGLVLLAIGFVVLVVLILWIAFPVFMFFGMRSQRELLQKIERNTRIQS